MDYVIKYSNRKTVSISIVNGDIIVKAPYNVSRSLIDEIVNKHDKWILKNLEAEQRKRSMTKDLTDTDIKNLKKFAKLYFNEKVKYYSQIMDLMPGRVTITSAEKRFGSCNSNGNICFSYRLMLYPEPAREYVVVHELAHLVEMNHSKRFYAIIESVMPDYKKRKRLLK